MSQIGIESSSYPQYRCCGKREHGNWSETIGPDRDLPTDMPHAAIENLSPWPMQPAAPEVSAVHASSSLIARLPSEMDLLREGNSGVIVRERARR
jgi:hypothetical protein